MSSYDRYNLQKNSDLNTLESFKFLDAMVTAVGFPSATKFAKEGPLKIAILFNGNIVFKTSLNNNLLLRSKPFEQIIIDIFFLLSFEILSE